MPSISPDLLARLSPPRPSQLVHREECTQCFDTVFLLGERGLDVCLECFNGACPQGSTNEHSTLHAEKTGHSLALNIIKRRKPLAERKKRDSQEPPIKKLAIRQEPTEEEKFETITRIKQFSPTTREWSEIPPAEVPDIVKSVVEGVLSSMSSAQKSEVQAWEEEIVPCTHTKDLVQPEPKKLEPSGLAHCSKCELSSNLWLCLVCGALGCGRQQFGGGGGNGHGLEHTTETGHAVAVKLGTIQPDGSADVYCYACDDARTDPHLADHLKTFGIQVSDQKKTEKSMTELQVEQNMNFDFAMTGSDGKELEPVFGPGLTGLKNLGNSCYMASSLQSLFSLPNFQDRYLTSFFTHTPSCSNPNPASCFECQMSKIADGLLSGRYSTPSTSNTDEGQQEEESSRGVRFQEGLKPSMFKNLVGKDHAEFSTMRQQDAGEFLIHLLEFIKRSSKKEGTEARDVTDGLFGFELEERLECQKCKGVRYKKQGQEGLSLPVPVRRKVQSEGDMQVDGAAAEKKEEFEPVQLGECLDNLVEPQEIEYSCSACQTKTTALKSTRFSTFPQVLVLNAARFQIENWVPRKVDVPLIFDSKEVDFSKYLGKGLQNGEKELPEDDAEAAPREHEFDPSSIDQLTGMGFPQIRAKRALLKTGNAGAEVAMNWLFEHMDDQDLDDPLPPPSTAASGSAANEPSPEQISMICDMGFTPAQGRKALLETGGDPNRAVEWLFSHPEDDGTITVDASSSSLSKKEPLGSSSLPAKYRLKTFISHKGPSVHSGHYVSHVWTGQADESGKGEGSWVLFNDEKVVRAGDGQTRGDGAAGEWMEKAYVYLFERTQ
ncbi:ubiquitin-specific protease UBP14 [Sporobolomyces salmoneus]|uniref:ubiquitin-specific protease UBP14 n=1 Tax=Sporobolomyces salmoneus TaxID=183962 RepID=UPI00316FB68F